MKELRSIKEKIEIAKRKKEQCNSDLKSSEKKSIYNEILQRKREEEKKKIKDKKAQSRLKRKFIFLKTVAAVFFLVASGIVLYGGVNACVACNGAPVDKGETANEREAASAFRQMGEILEAARREDAGLWSPHVDPESKFYGESILSGINSRTIVPDTVKKLHGGKLKAMYRNDGRILSFVLDSSSDKPSLISIFWDRR
ncbi:MAG TPA: hypothetical protein DCZ94_08420 [Lentisphaeria bacterium]|nr:MAG: hypothetical protein A2X48_09265 [Lentisphaerae bacterium GWF2_49_21]HBC86962.1 hypothetical protein [Lentisphaeria bacterium]